MAGTKQSWKTPGGTTADQTTDSECTDVAVTKCRKTDGTLDDMLATSVWKGAADAECEALKSDSCRQTDLTQTTGTREGTGTTLANAACKVTTTTPATLALGATQCAEEIAGYAYTSATDPTCVVLASTECRMADFTVCKTGTRATGLETCTETTCPAEKTADDKKTTDDDKDADGEDEDGEDADEAGEGGSNSVIFALFAMIFAII